MQERNISDLSDREIWLGIAKGGIEQQIKKWRTQLQILILRPNSILIVVDLGLKLKGEEAKSFCRKRMLELMEIERGIQELIK